MTNPGKANEVSGYVCDKEQVFDEGKDMVCGVV